MNRARERIESRTLTAKSSTSIGMLTSATLEDMSSTAPLPVDEDTTPMETAEDSKAFADPTNLLGIATDPSFHELSQPSSLLTNEGDEMSAPTQSADPQESIFNQKPSSVSEMSINEATVFEWVPEHRKSADTSVLALVVVD